ncbi:YqeB family protein [Cellulosimicrobium protaetiae]
MPDAVPRPAPDLTPAGLTGAAPAPTPAPTPSPAGSASPDVPTVVGPTALDRSLLWGGSPVVGAAVAFGLLHLAGWMVGLPWAPFQGLARVIDELLGERGALGAGICLAVGALAGLAFAAHAVRDIAVVTVDPERATLILRDDRTELDRDRVAAVLVDRKDLVVLGRRTPSPTDRQASPASPAARASTSDAGMAEGAPVDIPVVELLHVRTELATDRLATAFRSHGWPWHDDDPWVDEFRRWVPGDPALPPSADAVLRARAAMLRSDKTSDATELRRELARLDVVVRDVDKVQHWRPATPQR